MAKKGQTFWRYALELKLEAARLINEEHISIREVATRLDIQNKSQVQVWAAKAKQELGPEPATSKRGRPKTKFSSMEEEMACGRRSNIKKGSIQIYTRSDE
ncbi:transposase [Paenibacillus sp. FSL R5-192]|uniref:transposase n=1 Tax=Paenibacillus sp. FSL R5-192 TaxID=1226754 RepID=UPI0004B1C0DC